MRVWARPSGTSFASIVRNRDAAGGQAVRPCASSKNSNALLPMITVAGVPPFHSDEIEAERCASAAPGSGSEARADAGGRRLQAVVRWRRGWDRRPVSPPYSVGGQSL